MIDQLNSHAQVGVSVTVTKKNENDGTNNCIIDDKKNDHSFEVVNRYSNENQCEIMEAVGTALGTELKKLIYHGNGNNNNNNEQRTSRFCCPLDEALVECILTTTITDTVTSSNGDNKEKEEGGKLVQFTLPPYGKYPNNTGRTTIGTMKTQYVQNFFTSLAQSSGIHISLIKIRGDNGHHVVESAFKAYSRALRNLLDGTNTNDDTSINFSSMWGTNSNSYKASLELGREGKLQRSTKETSILVHVMLNGLQGANNEKEESLIRVDTGIKTVDQFVSILAKESMMSIVCQCNGDLYVDDHHTAEDVSIALGQVLNTALGTKAGLNRMWCASGTYGDAEVEVTMDLSNRPCLTHNLSLSCNPKNEEYAGDLSVEMLDHVLHSLVENSRSTVHIVEMKVGKNVLETALATAMAFGKALRMCAAVDPRRAGKTASSKGTLSV